MNNRKGLQFLENILKVYPQYRKLNAADVLKEAKGMQFFEMP